MTLIVESPVALKQECVYAKGTSVICPLWVRDNRLVTVFLGVPNTTLTGPAGTIEEGLRKHLDLIDRGGWSKEKKYSIMPSECEPAVINGRIIPPRYSFQELKDILHKSGYGNGSAHETA